MGVDTREYIERRKFLLHKTKNGGNSRHFLFYVIYSSAS
jgi:hypothetical protein